MRALNEPDAFPSGDLVLRRMAGNCSRARARREIRAWRPWRGYAVMLLWQHVEQTEDKHATITTRRLSARHRARIAS